MVRKREVLELIAARTRENHETSFRSLLRELDITEEAACSHLKRLWEARLIGTTSYRPRGSEFRLERGESIREIHFRLSKRGEQRLAWYAKDDDDRWPW